MKTYKDIKKLNYNEIAFFLGVTSTEAKFRIADSIYTVKQYEESLNKKGIPKITKNDTVDISDVEFKIKSNSTLEGKNHIETIVNSYNKGIPPYNLLKFSETKSFIKALKFSGKHEILNEILNKDQLLILQKNWLLTNTLYANYYSDKCIKFIESNDWSIEYLKSKGIDYEQLLRKTH